MYPCQKRDKLFSINPDRLLTELEVLELIEVGIIPEDCKETFFSKLKKILFGGKKKKYDYDYHIIVVDEDIHYYYDIKILHSLYDAMLYCDELSKNNKLMVFLYSVPKGNREPLCERWSDRKLMNMLCCYRQWRHSKAAKRVEYMSKANKELREYILKELPSRIVERM
jgi:hypothetical protein